MKRSLLLLIALVFVLGIAGSALAAGTDDTRFMGDQATRKRVGIIAYCADMYHNAGDTGLQSNKQSINNRSQKRNLADLADNGLLDGSTDFLGMWFLDGPFSNLGQYGAQNVVDYLAFDDGIDRVRDLVLIDGDLLLPTSTQLINNFDIVIAYTDNKCGPTLPNSVVTSATNALTGFVGAPNKKLILTGFAFSTDLGLGTQIYGKGLSPLGKGGPANAACTREAPCFIGACPATNPTTGAGPCGIVQGAKGPECEVLDVDGNGTGVYCTAYQPNDGVVLGTNNADQACREFLNNVKGPTSSSWATALTQANVAAGASLCVNYDVDVNTPGDPATSVPFIAINAARNIVAINSFPPDAVDIQKFWYGCLLGDVVQYLSGDISRCGGAGMFCY